MKIYFQISRLINLKFTNLKIMKIYFRGFWFSGCWWKYFSGNITIIYFESSKLEEFMKKKTQKIFVAYIFRGFWFSGCWSQYFSGNITLIYFEKIFVATLFMPSVIIFSLKTLQAIKNPLQQLKITGNYGILPKIISQSLDLRRSPQTLRPLHSHRYYHSLMCY